ncbi:NmrA family NAD(P)-binding protein [Nakamurella sp. GG22]
MKVLVTGATGNVGAQVVRAVAEKGVATRAFVRDRGRAAHVLGTDIELSIGDLADGASVKRAVTGVDRIFLACGNVPGQVEYESAVIDAAADAGVGLIVKLSSPSPALDSPLVFDRWHAEIEDHHRRSGVRSVMLRPRTFMTNLLAYADTVRQLGKIFAPAGDAAITFLDPRDLAAVAAAVLTGHVDDDQPVDYTVTGPEAITFTRIAQDLTAVTGREIEYVNVPDEAARGAMLDAGLPEMVVDFILGVFRSQRAGSMTRTTDVVPALTGRGARSFADFARDHRALFGAAPNDSTDIPSPAAAPAG